MSAGVSGDSMNAGPGGIGDGSPASRVILWPRRAVVATTPVIPARVARSTSAMGAPPTPSALPAPVGQSRIEGTPLPPLGPERYYPNGIAPLRPEFMHPVPTDPQRR